MSRSFTYTALILRVRPSGESNREAWFLTAEEGILRATIFGGPKSRLRAHAAPYHQGQIWIYHDPVRDSRKLVDFDVRLWRPGLRELYERTMSAGAVAETILAGYGGGGNWEAALAMAEKTLDALETADGESCVRILIHFLWNWAELLGQRPELNRCASCGNSPGGGEEYKACEEGGDALLWYSPQEGTLFCSSCAGNCVTNSAGNCVTNSAGNFAAKGGKDHAAGNREAEDPRRRPGLLPVGPGTRRWLNAAGNLDPALLTRYTLDRTAGNEAKALVMAILAGAFGRRLASWDF
ncbi:MAG: recombination protein O N-terminal domain-containing protein [Treponema sp.]|jgi:DNA repair protein RecO (recombination protein O)|nr:recombination protein O N-terminal domain-containing protein [Treponema sp.]